MKKAHRWRQCFLLLPNQDDYLFLKLLNANLIASTNDDFSSPNAKFMAVHTLIYHYRKSDSKPNEWIRFHSCSIGYESLCTWITPTHNSFFVVELSRGCS
mmetsp:Transcript_20673/g.43290  ORF Transcript_20673/g.43290 Transcript_20673/m.43290 type:complete len:100 (-) Transcript_20673:98-397(-)